MANIVEVKKFEPRQAFPMIGEYLNFWKAIRRQHVIFHVKITLLTRTHSITKNEIKKVALAMVVVLKARKPNFTGHQLSSRLIIRKFFCQLLPFSWAYALC